MCAQSMGKYNYKVNNGIAILLLREQALPALNLRKVEQSLPYNAFTRARSIQRHSFLCAY